MQNQILGSRPAIKLARKVNAWKHDEVAIPHIRRRPYQPHVGLSTPKACPSWHLRRLRHRRRLQASQVLQHLGYESLRISINVSI